MFHEQFEMRGFDSQMLQMPLTWQLPAPSTKKIANSMENESFELKNAANTTEMASSSSKMLQMARKMVRIGNPTPPQKKGKTGPLMKFSALRQPTSCTSSWQAAMLHTSSYIILNYVYRSSLIILMLSPLRPGLSSAELRCESLQKISEAKNRKKKKHAEYSALFNEGPCIPEVAGLGRIHVCTVGFPVSLVSVFRLLHSANKWWFGPSGLELQINRDILGCIEWNSHIKNSLYRV